MEIQNLTKAQYYATRNIVQPVISRRIQVQPHPQVHINETMQDCSDEIRLHNEAQHRRDQLQIMNLLNREPAGHQRIFDIQDLRKDLNNKMEEIMKLRNDKERDRRTIEHQEREIFNLKEEHKKMRHEYEKKMNEAIADNEAQKQRLCIIITRLEMEIVKEKKISESELAKLHEKYSENLKQIQNKNESEKIVESELVEKLTNKIQKCNLENGELKRDMRKMKEELESELVKIKRENENLKEQIEREKDDFNCSLRTAQIDADSKNYEIESLRSQIEKLNEELERSYKISNKNCDGCMNLLEKNNFNQVTITNLRKETMEEKDKVQKLQSEIQLLIEASSQSKQTAYLKERESTELSIKIFELQELNKQLEVQASKHNEEMQTIKKAHEEQIEDIERKLFKVTENERESKRLLEKAINDHTASLRQQYEQNQKYIEKRKAQDIEIESHTNQINDLKEKLKNKEDALNEVKIQLEKVQKDKEFYLLNLEKANATIIIMRKQIQKTTSSECNTTIDSLKLQLEELATKFNISQENLNNEKNLVQSLNSELLKQKTKLEHQKNITEKLQEKIKELQENLQTAIFIQKSLMVKSQLYQMKVQLQERNQDENEKNQKPWLFTEEEQNRYYQKYLYEKGQDPNEIVHYPRADILHMLEVMDRARIQICIYAKHLHEIHQELESQFSQGAHGLLAQLNETESIHKNTDSKHQQFSVQEFKSLGNFESANFYASESECSNSNLTNEEEARSHQRNQKCSENTNQKNLEKLTLTQKLTKITEKYSNLREIFDSLNGNKKQTDSKSEFLKKVIEDHKIEKTLINEEKRKLSEENQKIKEQFQKLKKENQKLEKRHSGKQRQEKTETEKSQTKRTEGSTKLECLECVSLKTVIVKWIEQLESKKQMGLECENETSEKTHMELTEKMLRRLQERMISEGKEYHQQKEDLKFALKQIQQMEKVIGQLQLEGKAKEERYQDNVHNLRVEINNKDQLIKVLQKKLENLDGASKGLKQNSKRSRTEQVIIGKGNQNSEGQKKNQIVSEIEDLEIYEQINQNYQITYRTSDGKTISVEKLQIPEQYQVHLQSQTSRLESQTSHLESQNSQSQSQNSHLVRHQESEVGKYKMMINRMGSEYAQLKMQFKAKEQELAVLSQNEAAKSKRIKQLTESFNRKYEILSQNYNQHLLSVQEDLNKQLKTEQQRCYQLQFKLEKTIKDKNLINLNKTQTYKIYKTSKSNKLSSDNIGQFITKLKSNISYLENRCQQYKSKIKRLRIALKKQIQINDQNQIRLYDIMFEKDCKIQVLETRIQKIGQFFSPDIIQTQINTRKADKNLEASKHNNYMEASSNMFYSRRSQCDQTILRQLCNEDEEELQNPSFLQQLQNPYFLQQDSEFQRNQMAQAVSHTDNQTEEQDETDPECSANSHGNFIHMVQQKEHFSQHQQALATQSQNSYTYVMNSHAPIQEQEEQLLDYDWKNQTQPQELSTFNQQNQPQSQTTPTSDSQEEETTLNPMYQPAIKLITIQNKPSPFQTQIKSNKILKHTSQITTGKIQTNPFQTVQFNNRQRTTYSTSQRTQVRLGSNFKNPQNYKLSDQKQQHLRPQPDQKQIQRTGLPSATRQQTYLNYQTPKKLNQSPSLSHISLGKQEKNSSTSRPKTNSTYQFTNNQQYKKSEIKKQTEVSNSSEKINLSTPKGNKNMKQTEHVATFTNFLRRSSNKNQ